MFGKKYTNMAIPGVLAVFLGCTPPSDNFLKRGGLDMKLDAGLGWANTAELHVSPSSMGLDQPTRKILESYGTTIKNYSREYRLDWRLVLAVMKQESRFSAEAESERGASGLMQIMPQTGEEVGRNLAIEDMAHPMNNIRGGIFYLSKLYDMFDGASEEDRVRLTLGAYNAGIGRIYDAQDVAAYLQDNPRKWQSVRDALPLLSKRYYTLHRSVWNQEKPRTAGWFGSSRQTLAYVDKVMGYYDEYKLVLN